MLYMLHTIPCSCHSYICYGSCMHGLIRILCVVLYIRLCWWCDIYYVVVSMSMLWCGVVWYVCPPVHLGWFVYICYPFCWYRWWFFSWFFCWSFYFSFTYKTITYYYDVFIISIFCIIYYIITITSISRIDTTKLLVCACQRFMERGCARGSSVISCPILCCAVCWYCDCLSSVLCVCVCALLLSVWLLFFFPALTNVAKFITNVINAADVDSGAGNVNSADNS